MTWVSGSQLVHARNKPSGNQVCSRTRGIGCMPRLYVRQVSAMLVSELASRSNGICVLNLSWKPMKSANRSSFFDSKYESEIQRFPQQNRFSRICM